MKTMIRVFQVLGLVLGAVAAGFAQERLPVPSDDDQQRARQIVSDLYQDEYKNAKSNEEKTALAKSMISAASETSQPVDRYVLLAVAMQMATGAQDATTTLDAIDEMDHFYRVDAIQLKAAALTRIARSAAGAAHCQELAGLTVNLSDDAQAEDRFEVADDLLAAGLRLARKAKDTELTKTINVRRNELKSLKRKFAAVKSALATLQENPTDAPSNLEAGSYLCFVKGDWQRGLPMLALSGDETYKQVAARELAKPEQPKEQAELGDLWWNVAQNSSGTEKTRQLLRAQLWYEKALPHLSGLSKVKVNKRLETIIKLDLKGPATTGSSKRPAGHFTVRPLPATGALAAQLTELARLVGHEGVVIEARFAANNKFVKATDIKGKTIIWDGQTGKLLRSFRGGVDGFAKVGSSSISPDGKVLATTQNSGNTLGLWDVKTGKSIREINPKTQFSISAGQYSPTGKIFGTRMRNNLILWNTETWVIAKTIQRAEGFRDWFFSADGKSIGILASNKIEVWNAASGQLRRDIQVELQGINTLSFSPDGRTLVVAPRSHTLQIYDIGDGRQLRTLTDEMGSIRSTTFYPGGRLFASGDAYRKIILWDAETGKKLFEHREPSGHVTYVHFSADGTRLVSGHTDGQVKIWKVQVKLLR